MKSDYVIVSKINQGYSSAKKYSAMQGDMPVFIKQSRECDPERKKIEKKVLELLFQKGVSVSRLIDLIIDTNEITSVYSWIDGISLADYLRMKSGIEQYEIGRAIGKQLQEIHSLKIDVEGEYPPRDKFSKQIEEYLESNVRYPHDEGWLRFIYQNIDFLGHRPSVFLHNDFQADNIVISNDIPILLDFERFQIGDPYYDLKRVIVDASISREYATGAIDGYFNDSIPEDFWRISAFYISVGTLAALVWFRENTEEYKKVMWKAQNIDLWYKNFAETEPSWYKNIHKINCKTRCSFEI